VRAFSARALPEAADWFVEAWLDDSLPGYDIDLVPPAIAR
jgi:hypothetical protein